MQVLEQIGEAAHRLQQRHARVYAEQIRPALAYEHIHLMHWEELDDQAKDQLSAMFAEKVFPILTPLAVIRPTRSRTSPALAEPGRGGPQPGQR